MDFTEDSACKRGAKAVQEFLMCNSVPYSPGGCSASLLGASETHGPNRPACKLASDHSSHATAMACVEILYSQGPMVQLYTIR